MTKAILSQRKDQSNVSSRLDSCKSSVRAKQNGNLVVPVSSELAVKTWRGNEILLHDSKAVDLDFIASGNAPLLYMHNRYEQIGVIENAYLEGKRLYAEIRFSNNPRAQEIRQDVEDGIVTNVSIGYRIDEYKTSDDSDDYEVTRWTPHEVSFVSIPADKTVGVGRNLQENTMAQMPGLEEDQETDEQRSERLEKEINEINALATEHNMSDVARSYIKGQLERGDEPKLAVFRGIARSKLPEDTPLKATDIGMTDQEQKRFSVVSVMRALADGDWKGAEFEREAMNAAEESSERGTQHGGVLFPTDIMNRWGDFDIDGNSYRTHANSNQMGAALDGIRAALATSGNANILTTDHLQARFIDNLRNASSVLRAGVTMLPGLDSDVEIPGGDQNIAAAWLASEDANVAESNPTFRKVTLSPKDLGAFTDMTRRMLQQSTIALEAYVRMQMIDALRIAIDLAGLYGTGANGQPEGIANTTGIGSVTFDDAGFTPYPSRDEIIDLRTSIADTNRGRGVTHIGNSDMVGALQKTKVDAGSGVFLMGDSADRLVGNPFIESNQVVDGDLFTGVWVDLMLGMWGGIELARSTEAKFLSGGIRYRVIQTVDYAVSRVGSFALGNDGS
jgi:HK97 family phage major capsid protein/HK97 family phage prohead protease